jgi:glycopeptide antibiotics resistance protein
MPSKLWSYDKLGHLGVFGGWTFLVGYYRFLLKPDSLNLLMIFIIGVLFGVGIELLQYSMPFNRMADFFDVAFDALGCFIAVVILYKIKDQGLSSTK